MPYTKTNWQTALITADNFNKLQTQYAEAVADAIGIRVNGTAELRAEVVNDFPAHSAGRIIYHTGKKMFFYSNGVSWLLDPKEAFWGDAQNGIFSSNGSVTFTNTLGDTVIRNYRNFTLNAGDTITTERGCRCLAIRSWGDIVINGTINLDGKGGFGDRYITIGGVQYDLLGGLGGNGGNGGGSATNAGDVDSGLRSAGGMRGGGGGGGGAAGGKGGQKNTPSSQGSPPTGGVVSTSGTVAGVAGTSGAGGSGSAATTNEYQATSGAGGRSVDGGSGGGGGGADTTVSFGNVTAGDGQRVVGSYGGGALVLLAMGNIQINGEIRARGGAGGKGGQNGGRTAGTGGGGGGSGGGKIVVIRRGTYQNTGSLLFSGGAGGQRGDLVGDLATGGTNGNSGNGGSLSNYQL